MKKLLFIILFIPLVSFGQSLPSDWSEKSVRNFFYKKGFKGIEGIYSFNHSYPEGGFNHIDRRNWTMTRKGEKFVIIYSKSDFAYVGYVINNKRIQTKFKFQETATNGLYEVNWYIIPQEMDVYATGKFGADDFQRYLVHNDILKSWLEENPKARIYGAGIATGNWKKCENGKVCHKTFWVSKLKGGLLSPVEDEYDNGGVQLIKMFPTASDISRAKKNRAPKKIIKRDWAGNGSGLIISKQGHIVTNHHVIKDIDSIEVEFKNDLGVNKFKAKVINSDESNDLAIIQIIDKKFDGFEETPNYNFDTEIAEVGTKVYAYGYPMALSIMGKEIKITDGIINSKMGFKDDIKTYQISAPIQGGNSGGPLFDEDGTLVGINSSGLSKEIADNVGYSIKSNYISNLISALPQKIELPYSYTIKWISTEKQIKRLSKYVVLIKVK